MASLITQRYKYIITYHKSNKYRAPVIDHRSVLIVPKLYSFHLDIKSVVMRGGDGTLVFF